MKRLLPRPPRRRANRPQGTEDTPPGTEVQPTEAQPAVPAGAEPEDPSAPPQPSFRNRGRLRRRLRFLRRVRELGYRDLGGLIFDQYKFSRQNTELVRGKITALAAVDAELRALEEALGEKREITELREPGISACPRCGTLHGSDARFCPSCGLALSGARTIASDVGEGVHGGRPQPQPQPQLQAGPPAAPPPTPRSDDTQIINERDAAPARARETSSNGPSGAEPRPDAARDTADQPTEVVRPGTSERTEP